MSKKKAQEGDRKLAIIDQDTGEIVGDYQPKKARKLPHSYCLMFYDELRHSGVDDYACIIGQMDRFNKLQLTTDVKQMITKRYRLTEQTIRNLIFKMVKRNILQRVGGGVYMVNPYLYTKANLSTINMLRDVYSRLMLAETARRNKPKRKIKLPANVIKINEAK